MALVSGAGRQRQKALPYAWRRERLRRDKGNQNALKHGRYTREAIAEQKALRDLIRGFEATLDEVEKS